MQAKLIKREVARLKAKYRTADPLEMCDALRIKVSFKPMGTHEDSCKGFYLESSRIKLAVINDDLPEVIQRIILPHEMGHGVLHITPSLCTFHELTVLTSTNAMEYEANVFAAEFLLEDEMVFDLIRQQSDFFAAASMLEVPPELLDFKLRLLQKEGYKINAPCIARADFLKRDLGQPWGS